MLRNIQREVYPRVCGGTVAASTAAAASSGLSPRVRGNLLVSIICLANNRSIPACAGEPRRRRRHDPVSGVYPRVCGGTPRWDRLHYTGSGLSPRVRGNRRQQRWHCALHGSIPACAGEPGVKHRQIPFLSVYPRVCGGTRAHLASVITAAGLSPRVRGNRSENYLNPAPERSIPACAGEPVAASTAAAAISVYPRVCGGTRIRRGLPGNL